MQVRFEFGIFYMYSHRQRIPSVGSECEKITCFCLCGFNKIQTCAFHGDIGYGSEREISACIILIDNFAYCFL